MSEPVTEYSFEEALKRLESIVHRLESGEATLEESITLYGEGDRLRQQCEARLQAAQARIEKITLGAAGVPSGTQPFAAAGVPSGTQPFAAAGGPGGTQPFDAG